MVGWLARLLPWRWLKPVRRTEKLTSQLQPEAEESARFNGKTLLTSDFQAPQPAASERCIQEDEFQHTDGQVL